MFWAIKDAISQDGRQYQSTCYYARDLFWAIASIIVNLKPLAVFTQLEVIVHISLSKIICGVTLNIMEKTEKHYNKYMPILLNMF